MTAIAVGAYVLRRPTRWERPAPDPTWWTTCTHEGELLSDALRRRDIAVVFQFLKTRGWSRAAIAAATGLSESRVREITQGRRLVIVYDVLERIAIGLNIDRGLMGLAYGNAATRPPAAREH